MTEVNLNEDSNTTQKSKNELDEGSQQSTNKDFFHLSKTCGENCSIILLVMMILLTLIFAGILIYCKYFRKPQKKVQNIVVQVKAISINQSVLEHMKSLSQKQMNLAFLRQQQIQSQAQNESQGDARTSVQMEQEYKNYLHNQALNNVINGKQMLDYDSSVQFYRGSQMKNFKDIDSQNPLSSLNQYNKNPQQNEVTISQQGDIQNDNNLQVLPKRFVKSEQAHYQNNIIDKKNNEERTSSSQSNNQQLILKKKSGLILNEKNNIRNNYKKQQLNKEDTVLGQSLAENSLIKGQLTNVQVLHSKGKIGKLLPLGNKNQMETVKEEISELNGNTKTLELNQQYKRKLNIQQQVIIDPSILDSSLNSSAQIADTSMNFNNSILNSNQYSCKNQNSKLLGEYFQNDYDHQQQNQTKILSPSKQKLQQVKKQNKRQKNI